MSLQISAITSSSLAPETSRVARRRSSNFHPSIWGDYFRRFASDSFSTVNHVACTYDLTNGERLSLLLRLLWSSHGIVEERIERLKGEVRNMLTGVMDKPLQKFNLIDQIQRLGIAYHFENEIDEQLDEIHKSFFELHYNNNEDDLHTTALLFRLLRQQSYDISCEIFNKFKDNKGNFNKSLIADVKGLLSLFEACHMRFHGDDILDDALTFTIAHLESIDKRTTSPNLERQVSHALNQPIHKGLPRLEARAYVALYQEEPLHNEVLLSLAKLDFNLLQEQHRKELGNLTRWWKDLDVERKFPFARDRLVEMYFWVLGVCFEPEYEAAREMLTKVGSLITIIDDIYDVYSTLEELELFTKAIERWDVDAKDGLPEYMQACYKILLDLYDEIGFELTKKGQSYRLFYAKEVMKNQVRAYFTEAKWFHQNYVPTMEEYMSVALTSCAYELLFATSFLGMGDIVTKEAFDWLLFSDPKMVKSSKLVMRLMDDIAGHKFEQEREHVASSVECFMKQYGVTEEEANVELRKQVVDAWKDINEELCRPTVVPKALLMLILNSTRVVHVMYGDEKDHFSHAGTKLKEHVTYVLVNPLPM